VAIEEGIASGAHSAVGGPPNSYFDQTAIVAVMVVAIF